MTFTTPVRYLNLAPDGGIHLSGAAVQGSSPGASRPGSIEAGWGTSSAWRYWPPRFGLGIQDQVSIADQAVLARVQSPGPAFGLDYARAGGTNSPLPGPRVAGYKTLKLSWSPGHC